MRGDAAQPAQLARDCSAFAWQVGHATDGARSAGPLLGATAPGHLGLGEDSLADAQGVQAVLGG